VVFLRRPNGFVAGSGETLLPLWFHFTVVTPPFVFLKRASLTVVHEMSGNAWSYLRLVVYGFLGLSEGA
jgi:hypothetical protein